MSCVQIRLTNTPEIIDPLHISSDTYVYIDLPVKFDLRETKRVTELTEVDKLKFDYTLEFDVDVTPKNWAIFKRFANPNVLDADRSPIAVQVVSGSHILEDNDIYPTVCLHTRLSLKLRLTLDHWARQFESLKVCEVDHGTFDHTCDNIRDVIRNDYLYQDGDLGIWFPLIDWGDMRIDPDAISTGVGSPGVIPFGNLYKRFNPREYWRPFFHATGMLDRLFCAVGWNFRSPLFESDYGRSILLYMIDTAYNVNLIATLTTPEGDVEINLNRTLDARAENTGNSLGFEYVGGSATRVFFDDVKYDNGNHFTTTTAQSYEGSGIVDLTGSVTFTVRNSDLGSVTVCLCYLLEGTDTELRKIDIVTQRFENIEEDASNTFNFSVEGFPVTSADEVAVILIARDRPEAGGAGFFGSFGTVINIEAESFIEYKGVRNFTPEGIDWQLKGYIDCELSALDLLKALSHVYNLKFLTDFVTRTVTLYPPYLSDWFGETVEGFYLEQTIEDISSLVDPKSKSVRPQDLTQAKHRRLQFKTSSDMRIEELELSNELWSKRVEVNPLFKDEEVPIENNIIEPTINHNTLVHVPIMRGEKRHNWDIGIRILKGFGYVEQEFANASFQPSLKLCELSDPLVELIPTASQYVPPFIKLGENNDTLSTPVLRNDNIVFEVNPEVYENDAEVNLYTLVYARWLFEKFNSLNIQYLIDLTRTKFLGINFRRLFCFYHLGRLMSFRAEQILDFSHCKKIFTPVDFLAKNQFTDLKNATPEIITPGESNCQNSPILLVTRDADTGTLFFSIGGQNNGAITAVVFKYQLVSGGPVVTIPNPPPIIATSLVGVLDDLVAWAEVTYETPCQDKTTPLVTIGVCEDVGFSISSNLNISFNPFNQCLEAVIIPTDPNVGFTVTSAEYNGNLGAGWIAYIYPDCIDRTTGATTNWRSSEANVDFRFTVVVGTCPPTMLTHTHEFLLADPRTDIDCGATDVCLTWTRLGARSASVQLSGNIGTPNYLLRIIYRVSDDGGLTWSRWYNIEEDEPMIGVLFEAQVVINFHNAECPKYCKKTVISLDNCDCTELQALDFTIECDPSGLLTYDLETPVGCDLPAILTTTWFQGVFGSGTAETEVGSGPTLQLPAEGDYKVVITFIDNCVITSPVVDLPLVGPGVKIAE